MHDESKEFANELTFDALASRLAGMTLSASITKDQLHRFWDQITDQISFDSRLHTFLDM